MDEFKFHPNLTDSKVVLGAVYMTSKHNAHEVIEIVNRYLSCNSNDKFVYDYLVQTFCYHCKKDPLFFLAHLFYNVTAKYNEFLRKLLNEPPVINSIKSSKIRKFDRDCAYIIAKVFVDIFKNENVLEILRSKPPKPIFITFGYHPAIAFDIELQKEWLSVIGKNDSYTIKEIPCYITNEALETAAKTNLVGVVTFLENFFGYEYCEKEKKALFTEDTLKKIITLYIVSENPTRGKRLLSRIKTYTKLNLLSKPIVYPLENDHGK